VETINLPEGTPIATSKSKERLRIQRFFTNEGEDPFSSVEWTHTDAVLLGADGEEKFRLDDVEVPESWSSNTVNIVAEKYFRVVKGVKETSAKQMFSRVADWIAQHGFEQGLFESAKDKDAFRDELLYLLVNGMYAFNSPVWFNVGVLRDPQCSACFIQSVDDEMTSIMDLAKKEVMLFKGGSGTGANLSPLRSSWEQLSGGGYSSGPVSFMKGFDAFAGVTKSGGTTRRAAKSNVLNANHPDLMEQRDGQPGFIQCKADAEQEAHDLYETGKYSAEWNIRGNVYDRVGYQNANHSVRVPDAFMHAVEADDSWKTVLKNGKTHRVYKARQIFRAVVDAAHKCGDPGLQFDTPTNVMHTCKESGRINASNPCAEYVFLDDSACNLGSLNLLKFMEGKVFQLRRFRSAVHLAITAQEIMVDAASYPSPAIGENSHRFRPLGLGYANLGALLTYWGLPYDSIEARNKAAEITALMTAEAYITSAQLAKVLGPFERYYLNKHSMLRVISRHRHAAEDLLPRGLISEQAIASWKLAEEQGEKYGFRNAQTTLLAPTGTISFLMDCDTTGIEPMLNVVVYKKVVGEGLLMMPSRVVEPALRNLGYSSEEITSILDHIKKEGTIHTTDVLKEEDRSIFSGSLGHHSIKPEGHVDMVCAVQPFLSGSVSKTVNMANDCTLQDIWDIYMRAWKGGMKAIAIFRDKCKLTQPISTKLEKQDKFSEQKWGERKKLPHTRRGQVHKFSVAGQDGYLIPGEYPNGELAEIFVRVATQGSALCGWMDGFAMSVSFGLQHGVPLRTYCGKFIGATFEPNGFTDNEEIKVAKSLLDYIFRWLEMNYLAPRKASIEEEQGKSIKVVDLTSSYDGPPCQNCGALTKRSGACYLCTNCGDTTGCS
jgi:ribonucleoside-diphosphate reductase alpha chain